MSKLEYAIRQGNFTTERVIIDGIWTGETVYVVNYTDATRPPYGTRISEGYYRAICDRIRRADFKASLPYRPVDNYTAPHTSSFNDIWAAYADWKQSMAF